VSCGSGFGTEVSEKLATSIFRFKLGREQEYLGCIGRQTLGFL
jgi:hypothetical protein